MKSETLKNANQNKTTRRAGYKKVYDSPPPQALIPPPPPPPKEAFRIKGTFNTNYNS